MRVALLGRRPPPYLQRVQSTPGLIAYWPLDEAAGVVAYDRSGNGRNGAHTGVQFNAPGVNLIANGGFETAGAGGADVFGTWAESVGDGAIADGTGAGEYHSGAHAAKLTAGPTGDTTLPYYLSTIPGQEYIISFWTRGDGVNAGNYTLYDVTNGWGTIAMAPTGVAGTSYQEITVPFVAPAGCTQIALALDCPSVNGGVAYFDDVSVIATTPNGIGDGRNAPLYDGVNDYTDIYSASLAGAFNGAEGTLIAWVNAAVWDAQREVAYLAAAGSNYVQIEEFGAGLRFIYVAGGAVNVISDGSKAGVTAFFPVAMTWSKSGDAIKTYIDGVQVQATATGLGTFAGALVATGTCIGAGDTTPTLCWSGNIAHVSFYNRALSPAEIAALSGV